MMDMTWWMMLKVRTHFILYTLTFIYEAASFELSMTNVKDKAVKTIVAND